MPTDTTRTVLRNISGQTRYFAYLGRLGATLTSGQDYAMQGDIWDLHARSDMLMNSLVNDLNNGVITILKVPGYIVYDAGLGKTQQISSNNGTPTSVAPDYGSYQGPAPSV
jgi:hypothetical protein